MMPVLVPTQSELVCCWELVIKVRTKYMYLITDGGISSIGLNSRDST